MNLFINLRRVIFLLVTMLAGIGHAEPVYYSTYGFAAVPLGLSRIELPVWHQVNDPVQDLHIISFTATLESGSDSGFALLSTRCDSVECAAYVAFTPTHLGWATGNLTDHVGLAPSPIITPGYETWTDHIELGGEGISPVNEKYLLQKKVVDIETGRNEDNFDSVNMEPSLNACGALKQYNSQRRVVIQCVDALTFAPRTGCSVSYGLSDGPYDGGHCHRIDGGPCNQTGRPHGELSTGLGSFSIPIEGLSIDYLGPEVAGDVLLSFNGEDPEGGTLSLAPTVFHVQSSLRLVDLQNPRLPFSIVSHGNEGHYGLPETRDALVELESNYFAYAAGFGIDSPANLRAGGATMSHGGLFDANWNGDVYGEDNKTPWKPPHCTHRNGRIVDLSIKQFIGPAGVLEKFLLEQASLDAGFGFHVAGEKPLPADAHPKKPPTHWHAQLEW